MDLSSFDIKNTGEFVMELTHPWTGAPLMDEETGQPVSITIISRESPQVEKRRLDLSNKRLNRMLATGTTGVTTEGLEADALEIAVACTVGWVGIMVDGKKVEFTPAEARRLYERFAWIREQVDREINNRRNFLGNLSKS